MRAHHSSNRLSRHACRLRLENLEGRLLLASDLAWSPATSYAVGACPWGIAAGDLNGDEKIDLAVANDGCQGSLTGGDVSVLIGRGDGTFEAEQRHTGYIKARVIRIADVNADENADLVVANIAGDVYVLLNEGDGVFPAEPNELQRSWRGLGRSDCGHGSRRCYRSGRWRMGRQRRPNASRKRRWYVRRSGYD